MNAEQWKKFVVSQGCIITEEPAEPHHVKFWKNGWGQVSDFLIIPLAPDLHRPGFAGSFHQDQKLFEMRHGTEIQLYVKTLERAATALYRDRLVF